MTSKRKNMLWFVGPFFFLLLLATTYSLNQIENKIRTNTVGLLKDILNDTHISVTSWANGHMQDTANWASLTEIRKNTKSLLQTERSSKNLLDLQAQQTIRDIFKNRMQNHDYYGYFIISPRHTNIASSRNENLGKKSIIAEEILDHILKGNTGITPPLHSDVPLPSNEGGQLIKNTPTMFALAPIRNEQDQPIAVFCVRLNPLRGFSQIMEIGRIGKTGETYAFGENGDMYSKSRFNKHLWKIGLIDAEKQSILNVQIRDPEVNMTKGETPLIKRHEQKLTKMAQSAIDKKRSESSEAYRDYRGVPVIGAWLWDERLGMGFTSEIDEAEMLATYYQMRLIILMLISVTILLSVGFVFLFEKNIQKHQLQLQKAHDGVVAANQALTEKNHELSDFAMAVSHDLRAPLGRITHLNEFIEEDLEGKIDENVQEHITNIKKQTQALTQLITAMLTFASAGQQGIQKEKKMNYLVVSNKLSLIWKFKSKRPTPK